MATVDEVIVALEARVASYNRDVNNAQRNFDRAMGSMEGASKRAELRVTSAARAIAAALAGISIVALGRAAVDTALTFRRLESAMVVATGSSERAAEEFAFLRQTADQLGIRFTTLAEQYVGLAAAARGTTLEGQKTRDIFTAISRAVIATGGSADQVKGSLLAIQQIISKGTVSAEELRGQLGERLPGAFQIAARAMGITTSELGKMLEQGQLLSEDFLPRFSAQLSKELPTAVEAANAPFQRFQTVVDDIKNTVASGFMQELGKATGDLADTLREMNENGSLKAFGEFLGGIISKAGKAAEALAQLSVRAKGLDYVRQTEGFVAGVLKSDDELYSIGSRLHREERKAVVDEYEDVKRRIKRVETGVIKASDEALVNLKKKRAELEAELRTYGFAFPTGEGDGGGGGGGGTPPPLSGGKDKKPKQSALEKYRESTDYAFEAKQDIKDFIDSTKEIDLANVRIGKTISFTEYLGESFKEVAEIVDRDVGRAFDDLEERNRRLDQVAQEFASSMQSAFEDSILRGDLDGAFDGLLEDMARLIIRLTIIEPLAKSVADALKGGGSGGGGFFGSLLSSIGTLFSGGTTGKATGGAVHPFQRIRVGEHGPEELRMGSVGGYVSPMPAGRGGGNGAALSVTINAPGATAETVTMIRREINNVAPSLINAASNTTLQRANRRTLPRGIG